MASQGQGQPTLEMEASDRMRRLGEDAQEAFASGNPDTLRQDGGDMMEVCIRPFVPANAATESASIAHQP